MNCSPLWRSVGSVSPGIGRPCLSCSPICKTSTWRWADSSKIARQRARTRTRRASPRLIRRIGSFAPPHRPRFSTAARIRTDCESRAAGRYSAERAIPMISRPVPKNAEDAVHVRRVCESNARSERRKRRRRESNRMELNVAAHLRHAHTLPLAIGTPGIRGSRSRAALAHGCPSVSS